MERDRVDKRGWESAKAEDVHLLIEMTDICNCRCIMCKQSIAETIHRDMPKQHMELGLFVKIIEDIKEHRFVTSVDPLWSGESTVHPDFKEMIYYLFTVNKNNNLFRGFVLNTNAINMDRELSDIFLDYAKYVQKKTPDNFMRLYFSIDAATPATYEKIRNVQGKNFDKALENIRYFVKKRKELGLKVPNLTFGFIVMQENQREAEMFRDLCEDMLKDSGVPYEVVPTWPLLLDRDSIYYRQLICSETKKAEELHRQVALRMGLIGKEAPAGANGGKVASSAIRRPCGALWRTPNIASNGYVVPCCRDVDLSMVIGNVKEKSLNDIWHGEKITEYRLFHIKGEYDKIPACFHCVEPEAGILTDEEITAYLKSVNREDLIGYYRSRK